jgi:hypothetical protein
VKLIDLAAWLPKGSTVTGYLHRDYSTEEMELLDQDVVQIGLENGITIDVGWYPEGSTDGEFVIRAFRDYLENAVARTIRVKNPLAVADAVRNLAATLIGSSQQFDTRDSVPVWFGPTTQSMTTRSTRVYA